MSCFHSCVQSPFVFLSSTSFFFMLWVQSIQFYRSSIDSQCSFHIRPVGVPSILQRNWLVPELIATLKDDVTFDEGLGNQHGTLSYTMTFLTLYFAKLGRFAFCIGYSQNFVGENDNIRPTSRSLIRSDFSLPPLLKYRASGATLVLLMCISIRQLDKQVLDG